MPRVPSDAEMDALDDEGDDRAETADEAESRRPNVTRETYDDEAAGQRATPGTRPAIIEHAPRPVITTDDLTDDVKAHMKSARAALKERLRKRDEEDGYDWGDEAEAEPEAAAPAPAAAPRPSAPIAAPAAAAAAPAAPELPQAPNPEVVRALEELRAERARLAAREEQEWKPARERLDRVEAALEQLDYDPLGGVRALLSLRLGSEEAAKIDPYLSDLYDDLTGHKLGVAPDSAVQAKRDARRASTDLARYKREQRAADEQRQRTGEADRARAETDRTVAGLATWLSTPDPSVGKAPVAEYPWLAAQPDAARFLWEIVDEAKTMGTPITHQQAAALANAHFESQEKQRYERYKHLLVPDQPPTPKPATPPSTSVSGATQPGTPPTPSQSKRTLTNTAASVTPTKPPAPPPKFDPNVDAEESRRASLAKWRARKARQAQQ
jgi:hypothetical protein